MKWYLRAFIFLILLAFLTHQLAQRYFDISMPFLDAYFDPFCLGIFSVYLFQFEHKLRFPKRKLSFLETIILIIFVAVLSEFLFPHLSPHFVFDYFDLLAIAAGGLLIYGLSGLVDVSEKRKEKGNNELEK